MIITPQNFTQYLLDSIIESKSCPICKRTLMNSHIKRYYCPDGDLEIYRSEQVIEIYSPLNIDIDAKLNHIAYYSDNCDSRQYFPINSLNPLTFDNLLFQINKINVFQ